MHGSNLTSGWDTFLLAAPFIVLLLMGFFRLDELFASRRSEVTKRRTLCGLDEDGEPLVTDPDGRIWRAPRGSK